MQITMDTDQLVFDYRLAAKELRVPADVLQKLEKEVQKEFPNDQLLMELHIIRALRTYAIKNEAIKQ